MTCPANTLFRLDLHQTFLAYSFARLVILPLDGTVYQHSGQRQPEMSPKGLENLCLSCREELAEETGFYPQKAPTLLLNVNNLMLDVS